MRLARGLNAASSAPISASMIASIAPTIARPGGDVIGESVHQSGYHVPGPMCVDDPFPRENE
jgi:hypothetical protein